KLPLSAPTPAAAPVAAMPTFFTASPAAGMRTVATWAAAFIPAMRCTHGADACKDEIIVPRSDAIAPDNPALAFEVCAIAILVRAIFAPIAVTSAINAVEIHDPTGVESKVSKVFIDRVISVRPSIAP